MATKKLLWTAEQVKRLAREGRRFPHERKDPDLARRAKARAVLALAGLEIEVDPKVESIAKNGRLWGSPGRYALDLISRFSWTLAYAANEKIRNKEKCDQN